MTVLLDANALIAAVVADHVHHDVMESWLEQHTEVFATCPVIQGALVRFLLCNGATSGDAARCSVGSGSQTGTSSGRTTSRTTRSTCAASRGTGRSPTPTCASLARSRAARLATLDGGLALLHDDVALLLDPGA